MPTAQPTLDLSASGYTEPYSIEYIRRLDLNVIVATGDAQGTFYLVTRATRDANWEQHASITQAKSAGNPLNWHAGTDSLTGREMAIQYVRTSGGADQSAAIHLSWH